MKKLLLYSTLILLFAGVFNGCKSKSGQETAGEEAYTVSAADSSTMVNEAADILTLMQNNDYAAAADHLYSFNPADSTITPLNEQARKSLEFRSQVFPVKTYSLYSTDFVDAWNNAVMFDVAFGAPDAEGNAPTTKMGFNIICKDGKYYPTILERR